MKVLTVMNHKGGVGKTTLAANIGAGLATRGKKVLSIDLDPQASLTFSFMTQFEWKRDLADSRTMLQWLDSPSSRARGPSLAQLVYSPPRIASALNGSTGRLDIIASHTALIHPDATLVRALSVPDGNVTASRFVRAYRRLPDAIRETTLADYDVVVLDCAPSFSLITGNAILASDYLFVPVVPDSFSYNGIHELQKFVRDLVERYNQCVRDLGPQRAANPAFPPATAVAFTRVNFWDGVPKEPQGSFINRIRELGVPTFETILHERRANYASALEDKIPAVVSRRASTDAAKELGHLVDEVALWIEGAQL